MSNDLTGTALDKCLERMLEIKQSVERNKRPPTPEENAEYDRLRVKAFELRKQLAATEAQEPADRPLREVVKVHKAPTSQPERKEPVARDGMPFPLVPFHADVFQGGQSRHVVIEWYDSRGCYLRDPHGANETIAFDHALVQPVRTVIGSAKPLQSYDEVKTALENGPPPVRVDEWDCEPARPHSQRFVPLSPSDKEEFVSGIRMEDGSIYGPYVFQHYWGPWKPGLYQRTADNGFEPAPPPIAGKIEPSDFWLTKEVVEKVIAETSAGVVPPLPGFARPEEAPPIVSTGTGKPCKECGGSRRQWIKGRVVQGQDYGPHEEGGYYVPCPACTVGPWTPLAKDLYQFLKDFRAVFKDTPGIGPTIMIADIPKLKDRADELLRLVAENF